MRTFGFILFCCLILTACGESSRGKIGIHVPVGPGKVTKETPYVISALYEGSPADKAGIKPDDIITEINGSPVSGLAYDYIYNSMLAGKQGESLTLTIRRGESFNVFRVVRE